MRGNIVTVPLKMHDIHVCTVLQIQVGLEAFLAKPDSGPLDFRDCAQVINPFIVTTKIDHCVEPTALSTYRSSILPLNEGPCFCSLPLH